MALMAERIPRFDQKTPVFLRRHSDTCAGKNKRYEMMMNGQESELSKNRILTIQKSPQRAFHHLKVLGKAAGIAIFSAVFYLLYWKDSSIREQYENIFWWITLIFGVIVLWRSEISQPQTTTLKKSPKRTLQHLKALGKIAWIVVISAIVDLFFLKDNSLIGQYEIGVKWLTLIFAAFAMWSLIRDWLITGNMTFAFDGNREVFRVIDKDRELFQLPFQAIKRIKIEESSNLFPVYILLIHLQDGQVIEIDTSANQEEINGLANQLSEMTRAQIVRQHYDEPLSEEEKEEQAWQRNAIYKGD